MVKSAPNAGGVNLKGRKTGMLSCKCCAAENFNDRELKLFHQQEIDEAILDHQKGPPDE